MKLKLKDFLSRNIRNVELKDDVEYKQITVKLWNKGLVLRKNELGLNIKTKKQYLVEEGDFLMSKIDARNGAFGVVTKELSNGIITNTFLSYRVDESLVLKEWFLFFVSTPLFVEICKKSSFGTTNRKTLKEDAFLNIEIEVPDIKKQRTQLAFLQISEHQSLSIQSESDRLLQDISDFRQEILTRAFRGDLTEQNFDEGTGQELLKSQGIKSSIADDLDCPPNWTMLKHNDVLSISGGSQPAKAFFSDELIDGYIQMYQTRDYGERPQPVYIPEKFATKRTEEGDILLARYGGSLGKVFKAKKGAYNVALAKVIQIHELYNTEFLWWYYNSNNYKDFVKGVSRSAQAGFNKEDMNAMVIPLPPLAEQHRIVAKIEAIFSALDVMEDAIMKQKDEAKACYEEILRKEMGKTEASTEPADVTSEKELGTASEETVEVKVG